MYHDSDDEPLSGDEDERRRQGFRKRGFRTSSRERGTREGTGGGDEDEEEGERPQRRRWRPRKESGDGGTTSASAVRRNGVEPSRERAERDGRGKRADTEFKGYDDAHPVIVVDYDLTLVDRLSRPFPGAHDFVERLRSFNGGRLQLILYSHGSPAYVDESLNRHFDLERKHFDEIISDNSARKNKPVTHVRRVIRRLEHLVGPYVIVDDQRSNLDGDQYDVVVDVTRMTGYDPRGRAVSVDYDACLCVLEQGVRSFLATKKKRATNAT